MCKGGNLNKGRQLHNINYRASRTVLVYTHRWIVLNVIWMHLKTVFVTDYMIQQLEIQQASSSTCILLSCIDCFYKVYVYSDTISVLLFYDWIVYKCCTEIRISLYKSYATIRFYFILKHTLGKLCLHLHFFSRQILLLGSFHIWFCSMLFAPDHLFDQIGPVHKEYILLANCTSVKLLLLILSIKFVL